MQRLCLRSLSCSPVIISVERERSENCLNPPTYQISRDGNQANGHKSCIFYEFFRRFRNFKICTIYVCISRITLILPWFSSVQNFKTQTCDCVGRAMRVNPNLVLDPIHYLWLSAGFSPLSEPWVRRNYFFHISVNLFIGAGE